MGAPYSAILSAGTNVAARVHFNGIYDELVMLKEIFVDECYATTIEPVRTILDLGANIGLATVWFHLKYPNAVIHCYEPSTLPRALLQKNLPANASIFPLAIAPKAGTIEMSISERSIESSATFHFTHMQRVLVQATTLDQAIANIGGNVDIVKMDIEGAEFDVLEHSKSLGQIREIVGEVHPAFANRNADEIKAVLSFTHVVTIPKTKSKSVAFHGLRKT